LTSDLTTYLSPISRGMNSQMTPVTPMLAHCRSVRGPLKRNRLLWAYWRSIQG
jgi:hypothetical protein